MEHMGNDSRLLSWQVCFCVCAVQEQRDMLQLERLQCEELEKKLKKTQVRKTGQALDYLDLIRWLIPTWSIPTWLIPTWLIPTWFNQMYQDWFIPTWYPKVNQFSMVDWLFQLDGWTKPWLPGSCLRKFDPETSAIPKPNNKFYSIFQSYPFFSGYCMLNFDGVHSPKLTANAQRTCQLHHPKRKRSSSKDPFSGAKLLLVSGIWGSSHLLCG